MQCKAAVLVKQKKPLYVGKIELQDELEVGQVLVKVFYSGICGSQLGEIDGVKGEDKYLPHLLGHEGSGEVMEIGPGVTHVYPGDKVVLHWRKGAGIESVPPKYEGVNAGLVTTFNEYAVVSENRVTKIPNDSDMKVAALFGCAVTTGFGVVENNAKVKIGESVVVFGAGGIGLNIIQAAAMSSAYPIIAVDLYENRLDLAKKMGATHTVKVGGHSNQLIGQDLTEILKDQSLDVFIDNTGGPDVIELGYEMVGPQGRVVCVGVPKYDEDICIHSLDLHFGKSITGSYGGETDPHEDIPRYMRLFEEKRLELKSLITKTVRLSDINEAISEMRSGEISGRCLIDLTDS